MTALFLSYVAGLLTTLNPCVLPMLPLVLAGTATSSRFGPLAFAGGMVLSFTVVGMFVATIGIALGITTALLREIAAVMFVLFGLVLLLPPLQARWAMATAGLATQADSLAGRAKGTGAWAPLLVGTLAGALWSPCSGPSLGAAVTLATEAGGFLPALARMLAFGVGAASVLLVLAYGSRAAIMARRDRLMAASGLLKQAAGVVFLLIGVVVLTGFDKTIEVAILDRLPDWFNSFTTQF